MSGWIRRCFDRLRGARSGFAAESAPEVPEVEDFATALARADLGFEQWWDRARAPECHLLYTDRASSPDVIATLRQQQPEACARTVEDAQRLLRHEFQLLGSPTFVPIDPERPRGGPSLARDYQPIDWTLDPVRGLRFPRDVHHREWNLYAMRPGLADIKLPWELARCQHWPVLAQAYLITGAPAFAEEIAQQLRDFEAANPVGYGIHWTCTMDVALRAANWAIALRLLRGAPESDFAPDHWQCAFAALFAHGCFIRANLENHYEVTSNHYLSNLVGLYFVGRTFAHLEPGRQWSAFARQGLEHEIDVQVLADGADFESSVPYHRLVAELFLGGARLADVEGAALTDHYRARLSAMIDYLAAILRPDGLMPQIGDADDGRLHILTDYGTWRPQDPRHLFGPAGATLKTDRWRAYESPACSWERAWWGFPPAESADDAPQVAPAILPGSTRHFEHAGIAVFRDAGHYLAVTHGKVGTQGFGNHKHNDLLSFELHLDGHAVIVDPGSHVYTGDPDSRNRYRGTGFHNTLCIDAVEQNELRPDWLFRLMETAHPETLTFSVTDEVVEYCGRHRGYERLPLPVRHERVLRFLRGPGVLLILDRLLGAGSHRLAWHFHAAPGVHLSRPTARRVQFQGAGRPLVLEHPAELAGDPRTSEYSPSYGVRVPCFAVDLETNAARSAETHWGFVIADLEWLAREGHVVEDHYSDMLASLSTAAR